MKTCATLLIAILVWFSWTADAVSQTGHGCDCPVNERTTQIFTVCYGGQECDVSVTYCNKRFNPASATVTCSGVNNLVDMYTTIYKICPVEDGCSFICDWQLMVDAVMCEMNPLGGDRFNVKSQIPDCGSQQVAWCWVIATPRCMSRINQELCLKSCTNECCIKNFAFCKDPVNGTYNGWLSGDCSAGTEPCDEHKCVLCDIMCHSWDPMYCPTCN